VEGLEHGGHYRITLGEKLPSVPLHSGAASCDGATNFDRLATGSTLDVTLPEGAWTGNQYCQVPLADLDTDIGLMLTPIGDFGLAATGGQRPEAMLFVNEMGLSNGCPIQWSVGAVSQDGVAAFPAGRPGQNLFMVRLGRWYSQGACPAMNSNGDFDCFDAWKISFEALTP
jgi:hypothetical protein